MRRPAPVAIEILDVMGDPYYPTELAGFNLEINLDRLIFAGDCMNQIPAHHILLYLRERLPEMVTLLRQLVLAESPSTVPDAQRPVLVLLTGALARLNYTVHHIPGRQTGGHLYARPSQRHTPQTTATAVGTL